VHILHPSSISKTLVLALLSLSNNLMITSRLVEKVKDDPELKAMGDVLSALESLDDDKSRQRVLDWARNRLGLVILEKSAKDAGAKGSGNILPPKQEISVEFSSFESVADAFGKAHCKNGPEKVLVVAAYLQECEGKSELISREINNELTHLGHGIKNITTAISSLIERKPKLMIQTRKEGKTKQAQKKYKVTGEGFASARKLFSPVTE